MITCLKVEMIRIGTLLSLPMFIWPGKCFAALQRILDKGLRMLEWPLFGMYIRQLRNKNRREQERLQMENDLLSLEQKALELQIKVWRKLPDYCGNHSRIYYF